jgi:heat-inducible transcriptional repressor
MMSAHSPFESLPLTERERAILRAIVHLYVLHASPVGSRFLSKYLERELKLSPATIRNVMVDLEERGYITHPHSSAGRLPTDRGYRLYVDSLMDIERLSVAEQDVVVTSLLHVPREHLLRDASRLLGSLSQYVAIVQSPILRDVRVRKVEMIEISSERVLVVLALESDIIRTLSIETDVDPNHSSLVDISRFVNERLADHTLREIPGLFPDILQGSATETPTLVRLFLEQAERMADTVGVVPDGLHVAGTRQLLSHPEFVDPQRLRSIIELVEDEDVIVHLLEPPSPSEGVSVRIGDELGNELLKDYSLVTTQYTVGSVTGSVGLIGPKRMAYGRVISLVDVVSHVISSRYATDPSAT